MNQQRGSKVMSLIGKVVKMDVDDDGKASGLSCVVGLPSKLTSL